MNLFRKVLTVISYIATGGGPILAASGVGLPVAGVLSAAGLAAAAWLHWLDSPRTPADVLEAAKASVELAKAVQAAKR